MLGSLLDPLAARLMPLDGADFTRPPGEPAVVPAGSVSWRVYANPVTLFVGGIAAVLLELGEPRVRHGVWDHSSFRRDPAGRLRRTGLAAMVTVYGARSEFQALAARVNCMHARIRGTTPDGQDYAADDPDLLLWVQATASWAFMAAYSRYARRLSPAERDTYYRETEAGAASYGVTEPPLSEAAMQALFDRMAPALEPSPILDEFMAIVATAAILPAPLRPVQRLGVRAAVDLLPPAFRSKLGLGNSRRLRRRERLLLRAAAAAAERITLPSSPAAQAARRIAAPRHGHRIAA